MCKYHIVFTLKYRRKVIYNKYKEIISNIGCRSPHGFELGNDPSQPGYGGEKNSCTINQSYEFYSSDSNLLTTEYDQANSNRLLNGERESSEKMLTIFTK